MRYLIVESVAPATFVLQSEAQRGSAGVQPREE